jgi:molybdopterin adenylyltransferase
LKPDYHTLAEALRDVGYATAHFGKWHLGHNLMAGDAYEPRDQGFELDWPHTPKAPGPGGGYLAPWKFISDASIKEEEGRHIDERMADEAGCGLVVTTGGTGPAPRDVTPEATAAVCTRLLPGFGELMRSTSLRYVPTAILSRQTAGIRGRTLIVNLPGRPKAIRENLEAVFPAIPYCLDLIGGPRLETNEAVMKAFRPPT